MRESPQGPTIAKAIYGFLFLGALVVADIFLIIRPDDVFEQDYLDCSNDPAVTNPKLHSKSLRDKVVLPELDQAAVDVFQGLDPQNNRVAFVELGHARSAFNQAMEGIAPNGMSPIYAPSVLPAGARRQPICSHRPGSVERPGRIAAWTPWTPEHGTARHWLAASCSSATTGRLPALSYLQISHEPDHGRVCQAGALLIHTARRWKITPQGRERI